MIDDYHRHEALDRTSLLCDNIGSFLLDHPFFKDRPDLLKDAEEAQRLLSRLYQKIGQEHLR